MKDNDIYYAVGFTNGIMKVVSNGTKEFAHNTAKYYRIIGYTARIYTVEQFDFINRLDDLEKRGFVSLSQLSILENEIILSYENGLISSKFETELLTRIEKLDNNRIA